MGLSQAEAQNLFCSDPCCRCHAFDWTASSTNSGKDSDWKTNEKLPIKPEKNWQCFSTHPKPTQMFFQLSTVLLKSKTQSGEEWANTKGTNESGWQDEW
jgi:hypothetical protein